MKDPTSGSSSRKFTPSRYKARKLAEIAIETIVNNNGSLDDVARNYPERFASLQPDKTGSKRQHVYERLRNPLVREEMQLLLPDDVDKQELSRLAKQRLREVLQPTSITKDAETSETVTNGFQPYRPNSAKYVELGLRLNGELVDQSVVRHEVGNVPAEMAEAAATDFLDAMEAEFEDVSQNPVISETSETIENSVESKVEGKASE